MAREWSLRAATNLRFREMEKTLIETFGCMPVEYKKVVRLGARRAAAMTQPGEYLGSMEKTLMEVFGCIPPDKGVIEFDGGRNTKKAIVEFVREESGPLRQIVPCA